MSSTPTSSVYSGRVQPATKTPVKRPDMSGGNNAPGMGFEAFFERGVGQSGARTASGSDRKNGAVFSTGPFKGMTKGQSYEKARSMYAGLDDSVKQKYRDRANMQDVRSPGEQPQSQPVEQTGGPVGSNFAGVSSSSGGSTAMLGASKPGPSVNNSSTPVKRGGGTINGSPVGPRKAPGIYSDGKKMTWSNEQNKYIAETAAPEPTKPPAAAAAPSQTSVKRPGVNLDTWTDPQMATEIRAEAKAAMQSEKATPSVPHNSNSSASSGKMRDTSNPGPVVDRPSGQLRTPAQLPLSKAIPQAAYNQVYRGSKVHKAETNIRKGASLAKDAVISTGRKVHKKAKGIKDDAIQSGAQKVAQGVTGLKKSFNKATESIRRKANEPYAP